jgi:hypothetical protein
MKLPWTSILLIPTVLVARGCSEDVAAQDAVPYSMTCQATPADGTMVRRCTNETDVCYILGESISCRLKEAGE